MRCISLFSSVASTGARILNGLPSLLAGLLLSTAAIADPIPEGGDVEQDPAGASENRSNSLDPTAQIVCDVVGVSGDAESAALELGFDLKRVVFAGNTLCFFEGAGSGEGVAEAPIAQTASALSLYLSEGGRTFAWLDDDTFLFIPDAGPGHPERRPARLVVLEDYEYSLMCHVSSYALIN
jgi:hypothetical protein